MRRDYDLIRALMLKVEACDFEDPNQQFSLDGLPRGADYHLHLLWEGGYVSGIEFATGDQPYGVVVTGLPWKGHDFLDSIRDATLWERTQTVLKAKGLHLSFEAIKMATPFALKAILGDAK